MKSFFEMVPFQTGVLLLGPFFGQSLIRTVADKAFTRDCLFFFPPPLYCTRFAGSFCFRGDLQALSRNRSLTLPSRFLEHDKVQRPSNQLRLSASPFQRESSIPTGHM